MGIHEQLELTLDAERRPTAFDNGVKVWGHLCGEARGRGEQLATDALSGPLFFETLDRLRDLALLEELCAQISVTLGLEVVTWWHAFLEMTI